MQAPAANKDAGRGMLNEQTIESPAGSEAQNEAMSPASSCCGSTMSGLEGLMHWQADSSDASSVQSLQEL